MSLGPMDFSVLEWWAVTLRRGVGQICSLEGGILNEKVDFFVLIVRDDMVFGVYEYRVIG